MELFIFARFHALEGLENQLADVIREVAGPTRVELGCLAYAACRSITDPQLFWIYSRWIDEAAFETHAALPHTSRFVGRVQPLIDHPLQVMRTRSIL